MSEIEELRIRIGLLEARLMATGNSAPFPPGAEAIFDANVQPAHEFDHEIVWDPQSKKWCVRYAGDAFTYGGESTTPSGLVDGLVQVAGGDITIYGHAVATIDDDDGTVVCLDSLTYDTSSSSSPAEEGKKTFDFLVGTVTDDIPYQCVQGAVHVGGDAVRNAKITFLNNKGEELGSFTLNQKDDEEITLSGLTGEVEFVGDIRYDVSSQQLQKRVDKLDLENGEVEQGEWEMIVGGQAVPHTND